MSGLSNRICQLVILHEQPKDTDKDISWRKYMDERLAVTFPADHPLAGKETITFRDLTGLSILAGILNLQTAFFTLLVQIIENLHHLFRSLSVPAQNPCIDDTVKSIGGPVLLIIGRYIFLLLVRS